MNIFVLLSFLSGIISSLLIMGLIESLVKPASVKLFKHGLPEVLADLYVWLDNQILEGNITREQAEAGFREGFRRATGDDWNQDWEDYEFAEFLKNYDILILLGKLADRIKQLAADPGNIPPGLIGLFVAPSPGSPHEPG